MPDNILRLSPYICLSIPSNKSHLIVIVPSVQFPNINNNKLNKIQIVFISQPMINKMNSNKKLSAINWKQHVYYPISKQPPQHLPPSPHHRQDNPLNERIRTRQVYTLKNTNNQYKDRENMYISKLMALEQGLENQHSDFIQLQQMYDKLLGSYKQKQFQVADLERKFRETQKYTNKHSFSKLTISPSLEQYEDLKSELSFLSNLWATKQSEWKEKSKEYVLMIESLGERLTKIDTDFQDTLEELDYFKNKERLGNSRRSKYQENPEQMQHTKKQTELEKQNRLRVSRENQSLKRRNQDLEEQNRELQGLIENKQQEISRLRNQRIGIHRQSDKTLLSPKKTVESQALFHSRQWEFNRGNPQSEIKASEQQSTPSEDKSLNHYFSFSRLHLNSTLGQELPNLPLNLEIDALIDSHRQ